MRGANMGNIQDGGLSDSLHSCLGKAHKKVGLVTFAVFPLFLHTWCAGTR